MCCLFALPGPRTRKFLMMPKKASWYLTLSHYVEPALPETCLGKVQVVVRPYVQFVLGSDLPSIVPWWPHQSWTSASRTKPRSPACAQEAGFSVLLLVPWVLEPLCLCLLREHLFEKLMNKRFICFKKGKEQAPQFMGSFI